MMSKVVQVSDRRSGGYLPTVWNPQLINSFATTYSYESDGSRLEELKQSVRCLFTSLNRPQQKLDMIDKMQRLDIAKYLDKEIIEFLTHLSPYASTDLFTVALQFRLLRQHCVFVTSDVFKKFMNSDGKLKEKLSEDVGGVLSLYEASYLGFHGEDDVLEEANAFTTKHLKLGMENLKDEELAHQIKESLDVPLHWRLPRMEARNFINIYQRDRNKNQVLLELATLDFNLLQSVYLRELKELAEWWKGLNMEENVPFARDRMVECYFWAVGSMPDPKFQKCRRNLTKYGSLATVLDDVYDIYGSMDELHKYTAAVIKWDLEAVEELPEYMKVCYKAMYDHVNEMVEDALNSPGINVLPYIKDQWVCYVQSLHVEAEWYYKGYMPTLDEHLQNAWISIGIAVGLAYAFLAVLEDSHSLDHFHLQFFQHWSHSDLFYLPSLITRLLDDLTTSKLEMERGEITNSIQCYMIQAAVCEEEARDHVKDLISESWKKLNKLVAHAHAHPTAFAKTALAMTRCVQRMYQFGDWFGIQSNANKDCVTSSLFNRI